MKNLITKIILFGLHAGSTLIILAGCAFANTDENIVKEAPPDISLSEFILGSWSTEHVLLTDGKESVFGFDIEFKDYDTVEVVVKENEDPTDITSSQYSFIDSNTIFVENKRNLGGETWHLERDAQKLNILITVNNEQEGKTLILIRK